MQPLDVACFGPLGQAYRTALQDFIYEHPGRPFGKTEFWDCLCIARDKAITKANILSGFEASGIWPLCPGKNVNRYQGSTNSTLLPNLQIRDTALSLNMTPHSREILRISLGYLESKIVQYWVVELNSSGVKELRSGKQVRARSQKHVQGPRMLDRAYVEQEKVHITAACRTYLW